MATLTKTEAAILACLREARGEFVSVDARATSFGHPVPFEASALVKVHVSNLRKKGFVVENRARVGYRVPVEGGAE